MSYLYVTDQGALIGIESNRCVIKYRNGLIKSIPIETLEVIEIFGKVQLTTQCLQECLKRGINIVFFSVYGSYYGRLISTNHVNVQRQRKRAEIHSNEVFKLGFSKKIINAKIKNQIVILRRYARNNNDYKINHVVKQMQYINSKVDLSESVEQLMGYEGICAKYYFKTLGKLIKEDFVFNKRTKRPPLDPFNSMISLGYSILLNEIYGKIEAKGLNPYFGFMHKDREKHPTLASDLMEEWRAVLVDSTVMSLINGSEIEINGFEFMDNPKGVYLKDNTFKTLVNKLENKFRTKTKYLSYIEYETSFRQAIDLQINQLIKCIETENHELYKPIIIR